MATIVSNLYIYVVVPTKEKEKLSVDLRATIPNEEIRDKQKTKHTCTNLTWFGGLSTSTGIRKKTSLNDNYRRSTLTFANFSPYISFPQYEPHTTTIPIEYVVQTIENI